MKSWFKDRFFVPSWKWEEVYITPEAKYKQEALVELCNGEVGWFGLVDKIEVDGKEVDRVYDILVPKQEVSLGSVDHEGFDLGAFLEEHMEVADRMKFYGHSHVDGPCNPSVIDMNQIRDWSQYGMPYIISHIQNKKGESYTRIDRFKPKREYTRIKLITDMNSGIREWAKGEVEEKVTEVHFTGWRDRDWNKGDRIRVHHYALDRSVEHKTGTILEVGDRFHIAVELDNGRVIDNFYATELDPENPDDEKEKEKVGAGTKGMDDDERWRQYFGE